MKDKFKPWQRWVLFALAMAVIFASGVIISFLMEHSAEVVNVDYKKKIKINGIEARSIIFAENYPREYKTWVDTTSTDLHSRLNGRTSIDVLAQRPEMVILWAGYAFSKDYSTPRGHMYALQDIVHSLRTGAPMGGADGPQFASCWVCKSSDVPRMIEAIGVDSFYNNKWAAWGAEIVNPIGCADCHEPKNMDLHISRPSLTEAFSRQGRDITHATPQEMRSLVCAQCHSEYYFKGNIKYPTFPWDKGFTVEDLEKYYDEIGFTDYIHKLSRAPILKAQHPDYEIFKMGIHAQRGVSCADLEKELAKAHIEAKFTWDIGATENEMQEALLLIRQAQWRWDFGVSSHGGSFHAPQETMRILGHGLNKVFQARMLISKVLVAHGYTDNVPLPDITTKEKAQQYIGLDMAVEKADKDKFLKEIVPEWLQKAKANGRIVN